jgi:hypothetical protein
MGVLFFTAAMLILAGLALATIRFGVDSRAWTHDDRPWTINGTK